MLNGVNKLKYYNEMSFKREVNLIKFD